MKFEEFSETQEDGKKTPAPKMIRTNVSEGSKDWSHNIPKLKFESVEEEYAYFKKEKVKIEQILSCRYNRAAFTEAQAAIRKSFTNPRDSIREWLRLRSKMDKERTDLVEQLKDIDSKLVKLKRNFQESNESDNVKYRQKSIDLLAEILNILKKIDGKIK